MALPKPFEYSDAVVRQLNRIAIRRVERIKNRLALDGFDELNVIKAIRRLYKSLDNDNRQAYETLWVDIYIAYYLWMKKRKKLKKKEEDEIYEMAEAHLNELLMNPNPVTGYAYANEVNRKEERAEESVNAVQGDVQKQEALDKALRQWASMTWWYSDFVEEDAAVTSMKDCGVKKVQRHELEDTRTCETCDEENGAIYDIDKIPPPPHPHCRRWFTVLRDL